MKKIKWLLAFVAVPLIVSSPCYAQEWAMMYSRLEAPGDGSARSIRQTTGGGYIVAGNSGNNFWILKLYNNGTIAWNKIYGESLYETARFIQQTTDGGYIVAGQIYYFQGSIDFWVLKLYPSGTIDWQKTYTGGGWDAAHSIQQTADGGYIMAGRTDSFGAGDADFWVLKLYPNGTIDWEKTYGGNDEDVAYSIQQTADGGYIMAGGTESFGLGHDDFWVLRLDGNGDVVWQKTYGGTDRDIAYSIQQTTDGGYMVAGDTHSFGAGNRDIWVLKLNFEGTIDWQKTYGGSLWESGDYCHQFIQRTTDGGFIVVGATYSFGAGEGDVWVLKLNFDGTIDWQKTYGGGSPDLPYSIQQTTDGGYIAASETSSFGPGGRHAWVLRLDENGEIPGCNAMGNSEAIVTNTLVEGQDTNVNPDDSFALTDDTSVSPEDTETEASIICRRPLCHCYLDPDASVIPRGGSLGFDITVTNNTDEVQVFGFATYATKAFGGRYPPFGYLIGPVRVSLNPYGSRSAHRSHPIPGNVPLGTYTYHGVVGTPGVGLYDECQFDFEVVEP